MTDPGCLTAFTAHPRLALSLFPDLTTQLEKLDLTQLTHPVFGPCAGEKLVFGEAAPYALHPTVAEGNLGVTPPGTPVTYASVTYQGAI